jgi:hypothetical protein
MTLRWFFPPTGPSQARQKSPAAEGFSRDESGRKAAVTAPVRTLAARAVLAPILNVQLGSFRNFHISLYRRAT